jgi:hypothetical protein
LFLEDTGKIKGCELRLSPNIFAAWTEIFALIAIPAAKLRPEKVRPVYGRTNLIDLRKS